ncbi:hypothetical protein ACP70R_028599 [Stipagrostis hirtigluma subsp. patula]
MYGADYCHENDHEQNGSKAVSFLLRLSELVLALASAVVMATASATTVDEASGGATATVTFKQYPPFVYLVGCNIVVAVLEAAAVYMQLVSKGDDDEEGAKIPRVLLVVGDAVVQALLYSSTGAVFAVGAAQISACADGGADRFCHQVDQSKFLSLGACFAAGLAAVAKDLPLPFSVWPSSSD